MTVKVKLDIKQYAPEELTLEIIYLYPYSKATAYIATADLIAQLKQLGLEEQIDFIKQEQKYSSESTLKFLGKSCVVRALWTIPEDMIEFNYNRPEYCKAKLSFALNLTQKECSIFDEQFIKKACQEYFAYINSQIAQIHLPIDKPTPVMQQLAKDLAFIDKQPENIWVKRKFSLALASLAAACKEEESNPSVFTRGISTLFLKKDSSLLPRYNTILNNICAQLGYNSHTLNALIVDYKLNVKAKQQIEPPIETTRNTPRQQVGS